MDLSVLIASRNEEWLNRTVADVLAHARADTEVIVVADGGWPVEPLPDDPRVTLLCHATAIGQRAAINQAARVARGRFLMKLDAHCAVDEGFDAKLIAPYDSGELTPDTTTVPRLYNFHIFNWHCQACGNDMYQGPMPAICTRVEKKVERGCGGPGPFERVVVWQPRWSRRSDFQRFDHTLHFQYFGSQEKRPDGQGEICDLMSSLGACWFMPRDRFVALGGCDEGHGGWGQFGTEWACKSWLSGGRMVVNKRTWYSHLFRTQEGFGFPYALSGNAVERARTHSRDLWLNNRWAGQTRPLSWLIEKFAPLPGWSDPEGAEALAQVQRAGATFTAGRPAGTERGKCDVGIVAPAPSVGIVYYTDNRPDPTILTACRRQLAHAVNGHRIVSVSINGPAPIGDAQNIVLDLERGYLAMFKQILAGLEALDTNLVFFAEHDVLYAPGYFDFRPARMDAYYYNRNCWKVDVQTGRALFYLCDQLSQLCASRDLLLEHYRQRVARVEADGFTRQMGFEPGTRQIRHGGIDDVDVETWMSPVPNLDLRHAHNLTQSRWNQSEFRNQKYCQGWTEATVIPGWGAATEVIHAHIDA